MAMVGSIRWVGLSLVPLGMACTPPPSPEAPASPESRSETTVTVIPPSEPVAEEPMVLPESKPDRLEQAGAVLSQQLEAIDAGDASGFCAAYANQVIAIGPSASEIATDRESACAKAQARFSKSPASKAQLKAERIGSEGELIWSMNDVLVSAKETGDQLFYRTATVLSPTADGLEIVAQAWSQAIPNAITDEMVSRGELPPLEPFADDTDEGLEKLATSIRESFDDDVDSPWFALGSRKDTIFSGTAPDEVAHGDDRIQVAVESFYRAKKDKKLKGQVQGGLVARQHAGGAVVAFSATLRDVATGPRPYSMRFLNVYVATKDGAHRPVLSLASFGFPDLPE